VLAADDVVLHNGTTAESIMDTRMRRDLFARIDGTYYGRSFVAANNAAREMWVCIPETGATLPSLAYIWNWNENTWSVRDLNSPVFATSGAASTGISQAWDSKSGAWDTFTTLWNAQQFNPSTPFFVGAHQGTTQLRQYDVTGTFAGTAYTATLERTGLGVPFDDRMLPDIHSVKFLRGIWPRIEGTTSGAVTVEIGTQWDVGSDVVWQAPQTFTIGTNVKIDCRASGRLLAVRFSAPGTTDWRLHGYLIKYSWMAVKQRSAEVLKTDVSHILDNFGSTYKMNF
jgi:hypothetical protein